MSKIVITSEDGKNKMCCRGLAKAGLKIPVAGDVMLTFPNGKVTSSFVGTLVGVDFYLHAGNYSQLTSDCFQPAWAMKVHAKNHNVSYEWYKLHIAAAKQDLDLPMLTLDDDIDDGSLVELVRPPMTNPSGTVDLMALMGTHGFERDSSTASMNSEPGVGAKRQRDPAAVSFNCSKPYKHLLK